MCFKRTNHQIAFRVEKKGFNFIFLSNCKCYVEEVQAEEEVRLIGPWN